MIHRKHAHSVVLSHFISTLGSAFKKLD